jgi:hypothetical protein
MLLFEIFLNPLIKQISSLKMGGNIYDLHIACPTLADDMGLVTLSILTLQRMLNVAVRFSHKWRFQFSAPKSFYLAYGNTVENTQIYLDNEIIPKVNSAKHLGTLMVTKGATDDDFIEDKIASARRYIFAFMSLGSYTSPISPLSATRVYTSMSLSRMTYGLEVSEISRNGLRRIEDTHWQVSKTIQGLNQSTPNPAVLPSIGWFSVAGQIEKSSIDFLYRILLLGADNIYKKVAIRRIYQHVYRQTKTSMGPIYRALQYAVKYDVDKYLLHAINSKEVVDFVEWKKSQS